MDNLLAYTGLIWLGAFLAGFLGALTGLGGGVVIVPMLVLLFGVDLRYAIGASLVSVIATSSGAAAAYVKEGYSNIRVGMFLEIATTIGALAGAFLALIVAPNAIAVIFGVVLLVSAYLSSRQRPENNPSRTNPIRLAVRSELDGHLSHAGRAASLSRPPRSARLRADVRAPACCPGCSASAPGAFKVLAMDQAMRLPFKVSTTTSNFMIGVTAAASAGVYLSRGYIEPGLAMPVMLGVLPGSLLGARVLAHGAGGDVADRVRRGHRGPGHRDDLQGLAGGM